MANKKSSIKRIRQTAAKKQRNSQVKSKCRTAEKKVRLAVKAGDKKAATEAFKTAEKVWATAANKNYFHKNRANSKISTLAKLVNSLKG